MQLNVVYDVLVPNVAQDENFNRYHSELRVILPAGGCDLAFDDELDSNFALVAMPSSGHDEAKTSRSKLVNQGILSFKFGVEAMIGDFGLWQLTGLRQERSRWW
jgi:hypothetical protein